MAASRSQPQVHQDYIARVRFTNSLPNPPNPPKLQDAPSSGLSNDQYTHPGFGMKILREQPLNIEIDAELGMPIDLLGIPGIFEGDETCMFELSFAPLCRIANNTLHRHLVP